MWKYHLQRQCSVKLAYNILADPNSLNITIWKTIRPLPIHRKILVFIWRACHEAVTVKSALQKRISQIDPKCLIYGDEEETCLHCPVLCPHVARLWEQTSIFLPIKNSTRSSFREWLTYWVNARWESKLKIRTSIGKVSILCCYLALLFIFKDVDINLSRIWTILNLIRSQ